MNYKIRKDLIDVWNAFMVEGASFSNNDIPYCPTTATEIPKDIITWTEARAYYNKKIKVNSDFHINAFVCFYLDDQYFDGKYKSIWNTSDFVLKVLKHFDGAITPDFSTYQDFPEPLKLYNTYRMRAFGYWLGKNGIAVINNVRWGTSESYRYCFDSLPKNNVYCIGTVGGSPHKLDDRKRFEDGLSELVNRLSPHTIIVYGSANYPCFKELEAQGIKIVSYPSRTARAFAGGGLDE